MKYDENVIDILRMYGESKGLTVVIRDTSHPTWSGYYKKETMLIFRRRDGFEQRVLLTWPEDMDAVGVIKGVMTCLEDALHRWETIDRYDIPSLYPKMMLNSFYGSTEWNNYRKLDVAVTKHMAKCFGSNESHKNIPSIEKVIFNDPATIILWKDGTKTIVKAQDGDTFDEEKGLAMAICKKVFGNKGNYCNELKKWLPEEEPFDTISVSEAAKAMESLGEALRKMRGEKKYD